MRRVRDWFGPNRAELRAEVETWKRRCVMSNNDRDVAQRRARECQRKEGLLRGEINNLEARLRSAEQRLRLTAEPERRAGCTKVRLHHRGDAEAWAERIIADTGGTPGELKVYPCRTCPRSPVTGQRYWHAGHALDGQGRVAKEHAAQRRAEQIISAKRGGLTIGQRVDPSVVARLRRPT